VISGKQEISKLTFTISSQFTPACRAPRRSCFGSVGGQARGIEGDFDLKKQTPNNKSQIISKSQYSTLKTDLLILFTFYFFLFTFFFNR